MTSTGFASDIWSALGGDPARADRLDFAASGALPSAYPVSDLAAGSVAAVALATAELMDASGTRPTTVAVDRRLASFWFGFSIRPLGWQIPAPWDPIAGDYQARDGWIRLHTNAPHHRAAALKVLGTAADKALVAQAVSGWEAKALEEAVVASGGCAAQMRSPAEWAAHPQGLAVAAEPLVARQVRPAPGCPTWHPSPERPLAGLKVLDLTRVLAGPVATRALAGYGAKVLRIDPPGWDEPGVIPDVTLGKACARLDLSQEDDRAAFAALLADADILVHGYRPGALEGLGFGEDARRALAPHLIDISLDAYGWTGPWSGRRGFDSLVQMSTGIAEAGMRCKSADKPVPLPVQALDHATGYVMAAAAIRAVTARLKGEGATSARLSLARTAKLLADGPASTDDTPFAAEAPHDLVAAIETTTWGEARRLRPPALVEGAAMSWDRPASALGSASPSWDA